MTSWNATCPDHGPTDGILQWCADDAGSPRLGVRCRRCWLWLQWLPPDIKTAPPIPMTLQPFRVLEGAIG